LPESKRRRMEGEPGMRNPTLVSLIVLAAVLVGLPAFAQQRPPAPPLPPPSPPYGAPITLEQAKKAADGAEAEARKRNMNMVIAIVEPSGDLVYFRRMDGAQYASIKIAQEKAVSAALFRRSSKAFLDRVAAGDMSPFALRGAVPSAGGIPLVVDGKTVGAIGTSGGADDAVSQAGVDALK
jgi:glc operon protein GlcG